MTTARDPREWRINTTSNEAKEEKITKKKNKPRLTDETQIPLAATEPKRSPQMQINSAFSFPRKETSLNALRAWNKNTSQMRKCTMCNLFICSPVPSFFSSPSPKIKKSRTTPCWTSPQLPITKQQMISSGQNEYSYGQRRYFSNLFPNGLQSFHLTILSTNETARNTTTRCLHLRDRRVNLYSRERAKRQREWQQREIRENEEYT